jgi:hypothetical protein
MLEPKTPHLNRIAAFFGRRKTYCLRTIVKILAELIGIAGNCRFAHMKKEGVQGREEEEVFHG